MDNEIEDTTSEDQPDDDSALVADAAPTSPDGGDESDGDWERVLDQVARDTATTKVLVAILLAVVVIASVALGVLIRTSDETTETATATTATTAATVPTSTEETVPSVAGEPCVAMVDPLPAGAPPMDIEVGPPPTSLVVKDIKEGTGAEATAESTVDVNYVGVACSTGMIFDTSYKGGTSTPLNIPLSQVIPGFGQGVTGMKVGGQRLIGIPSDQAYGAQGGRGIAPDESLWFVVELTAVTP